MNAQSLSNEKKVDHKHKIKLKRKRLSQEGELIDLIVLNIIIIYISIG